MRQVHTVYCDCLQRLPEADCESAATWRNGGSTVNIKCDDVTVAFCGITSAMLRMLAADLMAAADSTDEAAVIGGNGKGIYDAVPAE